MRYISGFTGSAGTILVPAQGDEAFLVTDGRYTIQAGQELDGNIWRVMQTGARLPTLAEHLKSALGETAKKVAVDASTCSLETWRVLEKDMAPHTLVALDNSPLGMQWEREKRGRGAGNEKQRGSWIWTRCPPNPHATALHGTPGRNG